MRKFNISFTFVAMVLIVTAAVWAAIIPYSQDFEGLGATDPAALGNDGWLVFGNVFESDGTTYIYGYGPNPAPNSGPPYAFCTIATGQGGAGQGAQQLSVFSDYNNADHALGRIIESNVFQEQTIEAGDAGAVVSFSFDAKMGDLVAPSTALAFIKTLDPANGYATTNFITLDMTAIPATWATYNIQLPIDPGLAGQILQFGFSSRASNYDASGVFYDNINQPVPVELMSFSIE